MDFVVGCVVKSKAGRDKEQFYVVTELENGFARLCDGKHRKNANPKLKNLRHLAPTGTTVSLPQTDKQLRILLREFSNKED